MADALDGEKEREAAGRMEEKKNEQGMGREGEIEELEGGVEVEVMGGHGNRNCNLLLFIICWRL